MLAQDLYFKFISIPYNHIICYQKKKLALLSRDSVQFSNSIAISCLNNTEIYNSLFILHSNIYKQPPVNSQSHYDVNTETSQSQRTKCRECTKSKIKTRVKYFIKKGNALEKKLVHFSTLPVHIENKQEIKTSDRSKCKIFYCRNPND